MDNSQSQQKIEFKLPDGFVSPEGKSTGDTIEIMATVRLEDGGRACLVKLANADMPGYEDKEESDSPPDNGRKSEFIDAYNSAMAQNKQPQT